MPIERRYFEQLNTPQSWKSPVSVIAHIDLDAFYAQCLGVHNNIDPSEPLGCRQWQSLIAINYPARKFGLKRGVSVDEARRLCPEIHLPHVATFKKGESHWDFHESPDPNNYKVSLDHFRRESRKIFAVFKDHFNLVEKAGIDEGFMDIGPEVYREVLRRMPELNQQPTREIDISHDYLIDIGAELVNEVRLEIHEQLHYTCSAGIAPNKQLAKLGSGFNKPFNQTAVHASEVGKFLAHFNITDAWGWGGKLGKEVLSTLDIGEDIEDQCQYIRDKYSLTDLQRKLKDSVAQSLYDMVRGKHSSEVSPRTLIKSMAAVKDFRKLKHLNTPEDVESWLRVFAADLAGRLSDLQDDMGCSVSPKTIAIMQRRGSSLQRKQQHFEVRNTTHEQFRDQIFSQAMPIARSFVKLPCEHLVLEVANIHELPKERLAFAPINSHQGKEESEPAEGEAEERLFVDDDQEKCPKCGKLILTEIMPEHMDWHYAVDLQEKERKQNHQLNDVRRSPPKASRQSPLKKANQGKKLKREPKDQRTILEFFK